jgi:hypothetical protein
MVTKSHWQVMGTGFPIFHQVMTTLVLVERDTYRFGFKIKRPEHCNLSTMIPLVINSVTNQVDLTNKANPCMRNKEHEQEL